jgi:L-aminopeptidase/D-esterase-like protein
MISGSATSSEPYRTPSPEECDAASEKANIDPETGKPRANTTIGVVATNAKLDKDQAIHVAEAVARGHGAAIEPIHEINDGDTYFTLATGRSRRSKIACRRSMMRRRMPSRAQSCTPV